MIKVYIASKLNYAEQFRGLRDSWKEEGIHLHARWFDQALIEQAKEPTTEEFKIFWLVDEEDVKISDALILYGEAGDKLRGALIETGIAIGAGILTFVVGDCPDFSTWQHHPRVVKADSLEHAKTMILNRFRI